MKVRFSKPWAASILAGVFSYFTFAFCLAALDAWGVAQRNRDGLDAFVNDAMAGGVALSLMGLFVGIGLVAMLAAVVGARIMLGLFEQSDKASFVTFLIGGGVLGLALGGGMVLLIGAPLGASLAAAAFVGGLAGLILRATAGSVEVAAQRVG